MKKKVLLRIILLLTLVSIIGCRNKDNNENPVIRVIYLMPQAGGQLALQEIENHPEILMVNSFNDLKEEFHAKCAIWIDKDTINIIDETWLHEEPQMYCPLVLIGYNDSLYSFREQLSGFEIEGPYVDWSKQTLEPGFSVWMLTEKTETSISSFMKGYNEVPSVMRIIEVTNLLLEGKFPPQ